MIELALSPFQGHWSQPAGVIMDIGAQFSADIPYAFRQVFLRENIIRQADGQLDVNHYGFIVRRSETLFVENNVIDVGGKAIQFKQLVAPYFFNNLNTAGKALPGFNEATMQDQSELANRIEDALLLSL